MYTISDTNQCYPQFLLGNGMDHFRIDWFAWTYEWNVAQEFYIWKGISNHTTVFTTFLHVKHTAIKINTAIYNRQDIVICTCQQLFDWMSNLRLIWRQKQSLCTFPYESKMTMRCIVHVFIIDVTIYHSLNISMKLLMNENHFE